MSLEEFYKIYPTKEDCVRHLEEIIWKSNPTCPYCVSKQHTQVKGNNRYHCNTCNTSYSVTVNTVFHKTKIDLQKWFYAIHILLNINPIISSREMAKEIKTTKDTAWRIINELKKSIITQSELIQKLGNHER